MNSASSSDDEEAQDDLETELTDIRSARPSEEIVLPESGDLTARSSMTEATEHDEDVEMSAHLPMIVISYQSSLICFGIVQCSIVA